MKSPMGALWFAAAIVALMSPIALAQVVPPAPGVDLPQAYFDRIAENPKAFQFEKAWLEKTRKAKETREAFLSAPDTGEMTFSSLPDGLKQVMMVFGTAYVPVLMAKYSNTGADPYPTASLQTKLFSSLPAASMTSLYNEMSYGNLNLTGTVYGWYLTSNTDTYYEAGCNGLCSFAKTGQYLKEVLQVADPTVDFGTYDNDGSDGIPNSGDDDGFVDFVAIVQPEIGGECGTSNIWSHRWVVGGWPEFSNQPWTTNDARTGGGFIQIWDYTLQPALGSSNGCGAGMIEIGVFCHEFGHAFGLPDLYDVTSGSAGIGHWGLMGSGNWNTPTNPAHFDAWCKSQLGWIVPTAAGPVSQAYSIHSSEVTPEAYKLNIMEEKFRRTNVNPISGSYSMRCFLTAAEATARAWQGGSGYGNGWDEAVVRSFSYNGVNPVNLQYDYACHSEPAYDFGLVKIDVNGTVSTLASYSGTGTGHGNIDLTPYLNGSGASTYTLMFQFTSDYTYSDEDGQYNSGTNGAFKIDNVSVSGGGVTYAAGFEAFEDGWHYDRTLNPTTEYFLVENRNIAGAQFDQALHGQGLVIYHVEQDVATTTLGNTGGSSNNVARGMMLEEADNLNHLRNGNNRGDAGDNFPGSTNNTTFDTGSSPNSKSLNALATNAAATLIGAPGTTMMANLRGGFFAPTIGSITPNSGGDHGPVTITDLLGDGFIYGATFLLRSASLTEYPATSVQWIGHAKLAGTLNLYGLPGGVYDVVVRNPDGQEAVLTGGFEVTVVVPAFVQAFDARATEKGIVLTWDVWSDEEVKGFRIFRREKGSTDETSLGDGHLLEPRLREFIDDTVLPATDYEYALSVVLAAGSEQRSIVVSARSAAFSLGLMQNVPNPFNPTTTISFSLPERMRVTITVYDAEGREVVELLNETRRAGVSDVRWEGRNAAGNRVTSGVYFYRLSAGNNVLTKKMLLLK